MDQPPEFSRELEWISERVAPRTFLIRLVSRGAREVAGRSLPDQDDAQKEQDDACGVPGQIIGKELDAIPDLVYPKDFMIYQTVENLETSRADEKPSPCEAWRHYIPVPEVRPHEKSGNDRDKFGGVQETIGEQRDIRRGAVIEVVPGQQLMEDDFIHRSHQTNTDQGCCLQQAVSLLPRLATSHRDPFPSSHYDRHCRNHKDRSSSFSSLGN
jgi:hypothetical protein